MNCDERCRKCGADHWTSRCRATTYASVTNEQSTATAVDEVSEEEIRQQQELLGEGNGAADGNNVNTGVAIASSEVLTNALSTLDAQEAPATPELQMKNTRDPHYVAEDTDTSMLDERSPDGSWSSEPPLVIDEGTKDSEEEESSTEPPQPKRPHTSSESRSSILDEDWHAVRGAKARKDRKKPKPDVEKTLVPAPTSLPFSDNESGNS